MTDLFDINGKVVVVTGAGGVLCGEIATELGRRGALIALLDVDKSKADQVAAKIKQDGGEAYAVQADVLDKESLTKAKDTVINCYGRVDVLINGAGGNKKEATADPETLPFFDLPADAIQWVFNLNILGTIYTSQVFGKLMADQQAGTIINVSSMNSYRPLTKIAAYSAAKASVNNFTQWLAVHMNQNYSTEIKVNAIAPGFFLTEQNRFLLLDENSGEPTARGQQIVDHTPMGRYGKPEDLMGAVIWLVSDASAFVTGIIVPVDGGFSAYSGV